MYYSKTSKWINVLSILLALLSMGELILTATVLYLVTVILAKTGAYLTTTCGLVASLVSMPTAFKVRSMYSATLRLHHFYMHTYHRFMLFMSLGVQTISLLVCCVSLSLHWNSEQALTSAITTYQRRASDKKFVDVIQMLFQCCGSASFLDWGQESWTGTAQREIVCQKYVDIPLKNYSKANADKLNSLYSVPYSCCKVEIAKPCRNFDIKCSGVSTINTNGCIGELNGFIISILFSEFIIYLLIILVIIVLLKLLSIEEIDLSQDEEEEFEHMSGNLNEEEKENIGDIQWQKFTNSDATSKITPTAEEKLLVEKNLFVEENDSKTTSTNESSSLSAELKPTSQKQILLSNDKKLKIIKLKRKCSGCAKSKSSQQLLVNPEDKKPKSREDSVGEEKKSDILYFPSSFEKKVRFK